VCGCFVVWFIRAFSSFWAFMFEGGILGFGYVVFHVSLLT